MTDFAAMLRQAADNPNQVYASSIFSEQPVSLRVFVEDRRYLGNPPLSAVQYDAVRHIERIYYPATYPIMAREFEGGLRPDRVHIGPNSAWEEETYWSKPVRMINFATLQWGKGGGKDHICRVASMRIAYLLLCLDSPQQYYEMPEQDTIHLLNVASSSGQAQQAFFMPIVRAVKRGWFAGMCEPKLNSISYAKNIESVSGHSDAESQEGLNLLLGIADEIDAFKSKKEMVQRGAARLREPTKSAESIIDMMRTSASTRFPEVFKQVRISYPRYLGSMIQRLTQEAEADLEAKGNDSRHYVSGPLPTWKVNPRVKSKDVFAADYAEDPVLARAKYECKPSRAVNPYFRNWQALDACFVHHPQLPLDLTYALDGVGGKRTWVPRYLFAPDFHPIRGASYAMHADLAVNGDRAGISMAHVARFTEHEVLAEDENGAFHPVKELRPYVTVDFVFGYAADPAADPPREIQIRWARQLCFELIRRGFNIKSLTFDGFQSTDSMQILRARGIESSRLSTDLSEDPWRTLRDLVYEGRIVIPRQAGADPEHLPACLVREELLTLTRQANGRIDHAIDGSKDLADAMACAVLGALRLGGSEDASGERAYFEPSDFAVGGGYAMPYGVNMRTIFETEMPTLF